MKNKLKTSTIIGALTLIIGGSLMHFAYQLSSYNPIVSMFSAVNESVWEHLKLGFGSLLTFSLVEYWYVRSYVKNYFVAKAAGLLSMQLFIIIFFYSYTAIIGTEILIVDILTYFVACIICQVISYKIYLKPELHKIFKILGVAFLYVYAVITIIFTFNPPKVFLFQDSLTGEYGTQWDYQGD